MALCFYLEILTLLAAQPAIPLEHLIGILEFICCPHKTDKAKEKKILKLIFITEQGCSSRIKAFKPLS